MAFKTIQKSIAFLTFAFIVLLSSLIIQSSANAACVKTATGAIVTEDITDKDDIKPFALTTSPSTFNQNQCSEEPLFYKIKFYEVMLCLEDPYTGFSSNDADNTNDPDFTSCASIFSGEKEIVIEPDKKVDLLDGDLLLPIGTYKYATVILSNHLQIKHYQRFADEDDEDVSIRGYAATGNQAGTVCYTGNKGADQFMTTYNNELLTGLTTTLHSISLPTVNAGTSAGAKILCNDLATAKANNTYAIEIIDHLGDGRFLASAANFRNHSAYGDTPITGIRLAANMLKEDGTSVGTTIENSVRLAGHFEFTDPVVIDEDVIGLNLDFNTSGSVSIDLTVDNDNDLIYGAKVGADPFVIRIIPTRRLNF